MFNITKDQIAPIIAYIRQFSPEVDFHKMGDWGIVFMCCGALRGSTPSGTAQILKHLNASVTPEAVVNQADDEYYALLFADLIKEWAQTETGISLARQRLRAVVNFKEDRIELMIPYFSMAIMLNSIPDLNTADFQELKNWVSKTKLGWPGFFFAAGLLLYNTPEVKWDRWASALLGISGQLKPQLKEMFDSYASEY